MNIDLQKWEDRNYYLKKLAEESLIGNNGLEIINFGIIGTESIRMEKI